MVNAADCKSVLRQWRFESSQSHLECSIMVVRLIWVQKIAGSSPATLILGSIMVVRGSAKP